MSKIAGSPKRYANHQRPSSPLSMLKSVKRPNVSNRIRRPDRHTGSQSSISDPRSGKSTNIIIIAALAVDHLRHLQDFLPGFTYSAEERRTKFSRPVYFCCRFERAPVLVPPVRTVEVTPSGPGYTVPP